MARRGKCAKLFSDSGKNFVGASNEIKKLLEIVRNPDEKLANYLAAEGIEWKFTPARSPNFGGLWEAAIKSCKYHLKRVVNGINLTYEELLTVTVQIEGILNSRPLCLLSNNDDDFQVLTPAHVLINRSLNSLEEPNLTKIARVQRVIYGHSPESSGNTMETKQRRRCRHSGNFIDLFKLLSKYDLTLREHMQRINEKQLTQHYLSHDIQNELIALMSKSVIEEIIHRVKQAKYYAFLLDCTRDVSRVEQMSIILRFCNSSTGAIEEHFIGFIAFAETTGEYKTNSILQELERNGLDIQNCRGQGYDNGANRVGINKGVRTRILNINPRAFFTPYGCHSWNLLLIDAANSSATAKTFFWLHQ
ncbi:zinc finger MYM-type protein 1 [Trichonephila clavipes]|nr:zinc finger MYM-type protein 1 [Trichonephila clavipes]